MIRLLFAGGGLAALSLDPICSKAVEATLASASNDKFLWLTEEEEDEECDGKEFCIAPGAPEELAELDDREADVCGKEPCTGRIITSKIN